MCLISIEDIIISNNFLVLLEASLWAILGLELKGGAFSLGLALREGILWEYICRNARNFLIMLYWLISDIFPFPSKHRHKDK
jgi:hypothetical protein